MAKLNLVELALRGVESAVLAKNIAGMNPSMIIASRLINGVQKPTIEQATAFVRKRYKNAEITNLELQDSFVERNVRLEYRYPRTVFWNKEYTQPEDTDIVSYDEFRKMDNVACCRDRQTDDYKYKMTYWSSSWDTFVSEEIIGE